MTQQELADELGVSKQYLSKVENGRTSLSRDKLTKLCIISGASLDWLLMDKGDMFVRSDNEETSNLLAKEMDLGFRVQALFDFFVVYLNSSYHMIKEKIPDATLEDITEAANRLFTTDVSVYSESHDTRRLFEEFKNKGRIYNLFRTRIFVAYRRVCDEKKLADIKDKIKKNNRKNIPGIA